MLERRSGRWRSGVGRRGGGGGGGEEGSVGGRRGGQALADGRLPGIRRRCRLSVMREKAGGLSSGRSGRRGNRGGGGGVLKRLIDRHAPSSRWVLADLGVGWGSDRRRRGTQVSGQVSHATGLSVCQLS